MTLVNTETGELVEPLSPMERSALTHAEASIEQGADQVAKALGRIRDERLYREDYQTFEAYCQERWGMTRQHVNRKIVAAEVAAVLEPMGSKVSERQARELSDLRDRPDVLRETYQRAVEVTDGKPTAAAIREVRVMAEPKPQRRSPLLDSFFRVLHDTRRKAESLHRLTTDDRWTQNAEKAAELYRGDLLRLNDLLQQVIASLPESESTE